MSITRNEPEAEVPQPRAAQRPASVSPTGNLDMSRERFLKVIPADWRFEITRLGPVRSLLKSRWFNFSLFIVNWAAFALILMSGVYGTAVGNHSIGIVFVWILWWSLLMFLLLPFTARFWCGMCPLPTVGEWLQRLRFVGKNPGRGLALNVKWPKRLRTMWIANAAFLAVGIFSGVITTRPLATTIMLGGIILLAVVLHVVFEKRTFCRYLCPVGGFLGLYSNFAAMEIRRKDFEACRTHKTKECFAGSEKGYGCPWLEVPMNLERNTYCGFCFECMRSCSKDNMSIRLRPFGTDLLVDRHRELGESWKAFIMLGAAGMYSATMMGPWGTVKKWANLSSFAGVPDFLKFVALFIGVTAIGLPLLHALASLLSRRLALRYDPGVEDPGFRKTFLNFSYALVPLGLMAWVAFSFAIVLPSGSYVLPVFSDPFGLGWDLFGTAHVPWTPVGTGIMAYLQVPTVLFGLAYAIDVAWKLARQTFVSRSAAAVAAVPQVVYLGLVSVVLLWLFVG